MLTNTGVSCGAAMTSIERAVCLGKAVAVRAKQAQVLGTMIVRIAIDVIHVRWDSSRLPVPFVPAAQTAAFSIALRDPSAYERGDPVPLTSGEITS